MQASSLEQSQSSAQDDMQDILCRAADYAAGAACALVLRIPVNRRIRKSPNPKGPELLTARSAFQKVYIAARGWAPDAKPYRLESTATSDGNGHDGKWAVWRGSFASASRRSENLTPGLAARLTARPRAA